MGWVVVGGVLVVVGVLLTWRMVRNASEERSLPGSGLAFALGITLVFWGVAAVVIGLVVRDR